MIFDGHKSLLNRVTGPFCFGGAAKLSEAFGGLPKLVFGIVNSVLVMRENNSGLFFANIDFTIFFAAFALIFNSW